MGTRWSASLQTSPNSLLQPELRRRNFGGCRIRCCGLPPKAIKWMTWIGNFSWQKGVNLINPHCTKLPDQSSLVRRWCALCNTSRSNNARAANFYNVWKHCKPRTAVPQTVGRPPNSWTPSSCGPRLAASSLTAENDSWLAGWAWVRPKTCPSFRQQFPPSNLSRICSNVQTQGDKGGQKLGKNGP